ncbi:lytic polysaccharide monooxygenase [Patellaria atrata CBS 101060]|uniref:AA9 family lytic polysaccharide monooxygenase n=1 Tax=Patellaria atrata CBS 101060 TaxID=1346257 RepID=A0A9P4VUV2_9PEZI|nr:lytic polysaccharide monooxygenase [Patellaria atrata CBS 101060]
MKFAVSVTALAACLNTVSAHYTWTSFIAGGTKTPAFQYVRKNSNMNSPVASVSSNDIRCNTGSQASAASTQTYTVAAGSTIGMALDQAVYHIGPILVYMSKAPGSVSSYDGSGDWFKVAEVGPTFSTGAWSWKTTEVSQYTFQVPASTPPGEYLVRFEQIGIHNAQGSGGAQFYINCAQVQITGNGGGSPGPLVKFPGAYKASDPGNRSSVDETREGNVTDDETVVDSEQGNMLMHIISQLRPGADLSRITLPTFILEPRSMLERITNFMAHPEILLPMSKIDDPVQRFVAVVKFYLSGWHIKPPGVKKPLNPILGEIFTGYWEYPDNSRGYYISEQTSHHPPKSSYFFMAPEHNIRIDGTLKPRSKFLGNSAASMMEGIAVMRFLDRNERFFITQPNIYSRGIMFGKMKYELGDHSFVRCPESGMVADLEFKTKGYFGGTYNAIGGYIKDRNDKNLFELSGLWNGEMFIKDLATGKKELLFDATHARETPPSVRPLEEQEDRESQKLWRKVTTALKQKDQNTATTEKSRIEDEQRAEAAKRVEDGVEWHPRFFRRVRGGPGGEEEGEEDLDWIINARIDGKTPDETTKQILNIAAILPGQKPKNDFEIPPRGSVADNHHHTPAEQQGGSGDLIDFGQNDTPRSKGPQAVQSPSPLINTQQPMHDNQPPARMQEPLLPSTQHYKEAMKPAENRPDGSKLARQDSESGDLDEFVDAES